MALDSSDWLVLSGIWAAIIRGGAAIFGFMWSNIHHRIDAVLTLLDKRVRLDLCIQKHLEIERGADQRMAAIAYLTKTINRIELSVVLIAAKLKVAIPLEGEHEED